MRRKPEVCRAFYPCIHSCLPPPKSLPLKMYTPPPVFHSENNFIILHLFRKVPGWGDQDMVITEQMIRTDHSVHQFFLFFGWWEQVRKTSCVQWENNQQVGVEELGRRHKENLIPLSFSGLDLKFPSSPYSPFIFLSSVTTEGRWIWSWKSKITVTNSKGGVVSRAARFPCLRACASPRTAS